MSKEKKKKSLIGGQAVIEGIMMRGRTSMATAVRDAGGDIRLETKRLKDPAKKSIFLRLPIIRGVVSFFDSMISGSKTLMRSSEVFGEGEPSKFEKWLSKKCKINLMSVVSFISVFLGLGLGVALFIFAPMYTLKGIEKLAGVEITNIWARSFIEGGLKILVFIGYILFCSLIKDVRRTFMYHGAEHKTITCFEKGMDLTVENVKKCKRVHDRCGTTFIVFVLVISILTSAVVESLTKGVIDLTIYRVLLKIGLFPIVAGLSYELLKLLAKTDCWVFYPIKLPGLLLQRVTTREPDDKMIEVAITAFTKVQEMDADQSIPEQEFEFSEVVNKYTEKVYEKLKRKGITEKAEAEWIISLTLGIKRDEVYSDKLVSPVQKKKIDAIVEERRTGRPLWYCIGNTDFYGYEINVDERVLIPRPETELLCEQAINYINENSIVLDLCTGSGAIAIVLKKKTNAFVTASDVSQDALLLAQENAQKNDAKIEFIHSNLFEKICGKFDVIVSNPPYIKTEDINTLQKEVKEFEPKLALDGGVDGLDFYRQIASKAKSYLKPSGVLLLEVGEGQALQVKEMLVGYSSVEIIKDLENIERIVKAVL